MLRRYVQELGHYRERQLGVEVFADVVEKGPEPLLSVPCGRTKGRLPAQLDQKPVRQRGQFGALQG